MEETDRSREAPPGEASRDGSSDAASAPPETVERIREALRLVKDPELGFSIVELGLVYDIEVEDGNARVTMTLTSPGCPAGGQILSGAQAAAASVTGVETAEVNLVWKPFWTPDRIDPKVRAVMGF
ncbi:MAG: metal-sulfur cluster assembly factor [Gemmatimonadota bacterium]